MTRTYTLVIEGDAATGYSAYVPELPSILVTGATQDDLAARAKVAIQLYWESTRPVPSAASVLREIEVELAN